jgi:hypothetical protein
MIIECHQQKNIRLETIQSLRFEDNGLFDIVKG